VLKGMEGDKGLVIKDKAAHHAISAKFPKAIDNKDNTLVVQYEVKLQGRSLSTAYPPIILMTLRRPRMRWCIHEASPGQRGAPRRRVLKCLTLHHHVRSRQVRRYEQGKNSNTSNMAESNRRRFTSSSATRTRRRVNTRRSTSRTLLWPASSRPRLSTRSS
jgi:hypothetical protein